jgi:hypothetical protein
VINSGGECGPDKYQYKVRGKDINGTRLVHCDGNDAGSCQRSLCECDLSFANELIEAKKSYSESFSKWKGFKTTDECHPQGQNLGARSKLLSTSDYEVPNDISVHNGWACCGSKFENSTPYKPSKGQRCCSSSNIFTVYALDKQQTCCSDGTIGQVGECPS